MDNFSLLFQPVLPDVDEGTLLRLGKLWVGVLFMYLLTVSFIFCLLMLPAKLNTKFVFRL